jgi:DinB superfamily
VTVSLILVDRSFVAANARELERMRALVSRLSDRQLGEMVNEYWSVAGVLGHIAFWDGRALYLAGKLQRGEPIRASENEPEDVDWINDSSRPLIHAIAPRALAELAVSIAVETDELVASLSDELLAGLYETSPLNPVRADHRGEHLDEIEAAIRPRT